MGIVCVALLNLKHAFKINIGHAKTQLFFKLVSILNYPVDKVNA